MSLDPFGQQTFTPPLPPASKVIRERIENLLKAAGQNATLNAAAQAELAAQKSTIDGAAQAFVDAERKLLDAEQAVLKLIGQALSEHNLSRIVIADKK